MKKSIIFIFVSIIVILLVVVGAVFIKKSFNNDKDIINLEKELSKDELDSINSMIDEYYNFHFADQYPFTNNDVIENQEIIYSAFLMDRDKFFNERDYVLKIGKKYFNGREIINEDLKHPWEGYGILRCALYDKDTGLYKDNTQECAFGGSLYALYATKTFIIDSDYMDDTVKIKTKVVYGKVFRGDVNPDIDGYYKSFIDATERKNAFIDSSNSIFNADVTKLDEEDIKDYFDQLPDTTYTFIKNGDNYNLVSVTIE